MRVLYTTYATWKSVALANSFKVYEQPVGANILHVWCGTRDVIYRSDVRATDYSDYNTSFPEGPNRIDVPGEDEALALIIGLATVLKPKSPSGIPIIEKSLPEGRRCDQYTVNFSDKHTWYQGSERNTDEVLVDSGDHTTYNLTTPCDLVDVKHGKVFNEDSLAPEYGTIVKVDDVTKTENYPGTTNGDYDVNYTTGAVTFNSALVGTEVVKLSYSKVGTSLHSIVPPAGYLMRIGYVEVQLSKDFGLKDTLKFQLWGEHPAYPGNPDYLIPYTAAEVYKTMDDFIVDSEKAYPEVPVLTGGDSWRMYIHPRVIFRFDYTTRAATDLYANMLMEIRVWLENDTECDGEYAVGTFYGVKEAP